MILSVIIVNYRVRYFLELCLHSVERALQDDDAEILVVDNHSADGSIEELWLLFPRVKFIVNTENLGFARANNQALAQAAGEHILFLNPDTILPENFFSECLSFLRSTPDIGALGVRMIDGSGRFLKESRRGFPSPWVAFCKLSGLTALFPRAKLFSGYYLGYLPETVPHPSSVLSGACFLVSRAILNEVGSFDDSFFMYAEDIDLSYRIEKAGYRNYYFPGTTIVHFKGESTQKDIRYTRQFYKAMSQFRRKHVNRGLPRFFGAGLEAAIWLRAGVGAIGRIFRRETAAAPTATGTTAALPPRLIWFIGDPSEAARLRAQLGHPAARPDTLPPPGDRTLASGPQQAEEIIICQGDGFSFKEGIELLEASAFYRQGQYAKFHAAGSRSAVGSARRDGRGEAWLL